MLPLPPPLIHICSATSLNQFPKTNKPYRQVQERVSQTGAALNAAAGEVVTASRGTPNQLATSTKKFSVSYQDLVDSGMTLAGQAPVSCLRYYLLLFRVCGA